MPTPADTLNIAPVDSLPADSATFDAAHAHIIMDPPAAVTPRGEAAPAHSSSLSWVLLALISIFVVISLRFRGNLRFVGSMFRELTGDPGRRNMFDDTMPEATFTALLNILCIASSGVLLWQYIRTGIAVPIASLLPCLGICAMLTAALYIVQLIAYFFIGHIFVTPHLTTVWIRSFTASNALLSFLLFPLALLTIFYSQSLPALLIPAIIAILLARLTFVFKGLRIFHSHGGNFLTFLYYLCSVEVVPVVIMLAIASSLCHSACA